MSGQGRKVFVVDDEPVIAVTLAATLRLHGFTAVSFTDPTHALASALSDPPDLILTDVVMPGISGIELALQIRGLCPTCKVLVFSGQADNVAFSQDAERIGENFHILPKPLRTSDLLDAIRDQGLLH